jgi:hypothetical protein
MIEMIGVYKNQMLRRRELQPKQLRHMTMSLENNVEVRCYDNHMHDQMSLNRQVQRSDVI